MLFESHLVISRDIRHQENQEVKDRVFRMILLDFTADRHTFTVVGTKSPHSQFVATYLLLHQASHQCLVLLSSHLLSCAFTLLPPVSSGCRQLLELATIRSLLRGVRASRQGLPPLLQEERPLEVDQQSRRMKTVLPIVRL